MRYNERYNEKHNSQEWYNGNNSTIDIIVRYHGDTVGSDMLLMPYIWVNYISLTWHVGPFGDDSSY